MDDGPGATVARLEAAHEEAARHVGEATCRIWRLYKAASALAFESGGTAIHQILASRRSPRGIPPATRSPSTEEKGLVGRKESVP